MKKGNNRKAVAEKLKFEIYAKNCGYVTNSKKFLKRTAPVNSEGNGRKMARRASESCAI